MQEEIIKLKEIIPAFLFEMIQDFNSLSQSEIKKILEEKVSFIEKNDPIEKLFYDLFSNKKEDGCQHLSYEFFLSKIKAAYIDSSNNNFNLYTPVNHCNSNQDTFQYFKLSRKNLSEIFTSPKSKERDIKEGYKEDLKVNFKELKEQNNFSIFGKISNYSFENMEHNHSKKTSLEIEERERKLQEFNREKSICNFQNFSTKSNSLVTNKLASPYFNDVLLEKASNKYEKGKTSLIESDKIQVKVNLDFSKSNPSEKYEKILLGRKRKQKNQSQKKNKKIQVLGLKEISKKVKKIIQTNKVTNYKQISDLIVSEADTLSDQDSKNIRRRIYDALNVIKALNLFSNTENDNKLIVWNNELSKLDYIDTLNTQINQIAFTIKCKLENIEKLMFEINSFKSLIYENKLKDSKQEKLFPPFFIISYANKFADSIIIQNDHQSKFFIANTTPLNLTGDLDFFKKKYLEKNS